MRFRWSNLPKLVTPSCAVTSLPSTTTELGIRVPREYLLTIGVQR
jgi:hypothetical protein